MPQSIEEKRAKNAAYMREYKRRKRAENPDFFKPAARAERRRAYYRDPEKFRRLSRAYRENMTVEEKAAKYEYDRRWLRTHRGAYLWYNAKRRAKQEGLPFDIEKSDVVVPDICPVLGIKMEFSPGPGGRGFGETSPSLDRLVPSLGYVKGNVFVISYRANRIKRDATAAELRAVADYIERGEL